MNSFMMRLAQSEDLGEIRHIAQEAWFSLYHEILSDDVIKRVIDSWYKIESLQSALQRENAPFYVVIDNNSSRVVGFMQVGILGTTAEIYRFYVLPEYSKQELYEMFLMYLQEQLPSSVDRLVIWVPRENQNLVTIYDKLGFSVQKEVENDVFGVLVLDVEMMKPLK